MCKVFVERKYIDKLRELGIPYHNIIEDEVIDGELLDCSENILLTIKRKVLDAFPQYNVKCNDTTDYSLKLYVEDVIYGKKFLSISIDTNKIIIRDTSLFDLGCTEEFLKDIIGDLTKMNMKLIFVDPKNKLLLDIVNELELI